MAAKLRQPGCVWVTPTPSTHPCAEAGRSARRVVEPRNTTRTPSGPAEGCVIDDFVQPEPAAASAAPTGTSSSKARAAANRTAAPRRRRGRSRLLRLARHPRVVALAIDRGHLRAHRPKIHRQLAAVVDCVVQPELDVDDRGELEKAAEVDVLDHLIA